ncbi:malate dehydrogenase [Marinobacter sp. NP-4(2019)]|uniref:malate dehydrogenase n=1 Tax=Marinobacter sp. NP-4(2019) TaxID=2488665 RepID=UPI000FC3F2A5|nr:malate dehydrogenase [Marinobacter sp. NP-4(2019)]AZT84790.1 malate dehydrogenase [Marinobacter sp. NP-4(2019)]
MKRPVRIAITGAAGSVGYSLLFKIATGDMIDRNQPVILQLIEVPEAMGTLRGVAMELEDCAFPLLHSISLHDKFEEGVVGAHYVLLLGAKPRGPGMERSELIAVNAPAFASQGRAINQFANRDVKVLVVGNPANTNALCASRNAPDLSPAQFTALTRLDHNRARGILANHTGANPKDIRRITIWGNHSNTQFPDLSHATIYGEPAMSQVDERWYRDHFIQKIQKRGAAVIEARGRSSAASAAQAVINHMHDWINGTDENDWVSMAIVSDGSYGVAKGIVYSFPVRCDYGRYQIVQGLEISDFAREKMTATEQELLTEMKTVADLLPKETEASHLNLSVGLRSGQYLRTDRVR